MSVKVKHSSTYALHFCTFTCYKWINLFEITNSYDCVYKWFAYLQHKQVDVVAYVIMPNHVHVILYFPTEHFDLNKVIGNGKRFIAYEIIKRLQTGSQQDILDTLHGGVTSRESRKGQIHKVFEESFDAKPIFTEDFLFQKIDYIHHNPVQGKWQLANDYCEYPHSSASFYELNKTGLFQPRHYNDL